MTTDLKASEKLLAYDGDCPMCIATVGLLLRIGLVRPEQARSNYELEGADLEAAHLAGIHNQLVVLDRHSREVRSGSDALLWIIGDNTGRHFLVRLLSLPGVRHLLRYGYQTISYNRRVISPPRHQIVCDCEPEVTVVRRLTLVVPLLLATIVLTGCFGAAVFVGWRLGDAITGAAFSLIAAGSGWLVMFAAGLTLLGGMQRIDYLAHLTVTMFTGAVVLMPAAIVSPFLPRPAAVAIDCLCVLAGFALMFAMQRRRVAALGLRSIWLWAWAAVLVLASSGCILSHFRKEIF